MESENKAVAVIQADRDAAAALAEQIAGPTNGKDQIAQCREGKQDDTHLVQTLARHRLAHQRPQGEVVGTVPCPMCRAPAIREETPPYVVTVQDEHGEEYEENRLGTARYRYAHPAPEPAGDLVEMIEQLHQLARKQEGYGMSFHDPACAPCNLHKGGYSLEQWRTYLQRSAEIVRKQTSTFRAGERFGIITVTERPVRFYFEIAAQEGQPPC